MQEYNFVDRILQVDAEAGTVTTCMTFPKDADYFGGTFRTQEEVPASLLLESMAYAGSVLLCLRSGYTAQGVLLKVNRATFPGQVGPGGSVTITTRLVAAQGEWRMASALGQGGALAQTISQCRVGERLVADGDLMFLGVSLAATLGARREEVLARVRRLVAAR
jgi:3-hydroxymyristoyl/3-hydroxydecanoyl-(acyl carrier protein) dehydratase